MRGRANGAEVGDRGGTALSTVGPSPPIGALEAKLSDRVLPPSISFCDQAKCRAPAAMGRPPTGLTIRLQAS
jgi:hypothetical protein